MDLQNSAKLCRLCLCSSKCFINVLEENGELGFIVAKTIEDLLQFKVVKLGNYPWLACSTCLEKLIDFRLFKSRCIDSNITFEKRFRQFNIGQFGPKSDPRMVPNETETRNEENQCGSEDRVDMSKKCKVLMETKSADNLESSDIWHCYKNENENMVMCKSATDEELNSQEKNSDAQHKDIYIEVEESMEIKEEPQDVEENESVNPVEVPNETETRNEENQCGSEDRVDMSNDMIMCRSATDEELNSQERNSDSQHKDIYIEVEESMEIKEEPQDVTENESVNPVEGNTSLQFGNNAECASECVGPEKTMPRERPLSKVSEIFGVDLVLCNENLLPNSHLNGPHNSEPGGNEMVAASENSTLGSIGQSYKLEGGNNHITERFCCVHCNYFFISERSLQDHIVEHQERSLGLQIGEIPPPNMDINVEEGMYRDMHYNSAPINLSMKVSESSKILCSAGDQMPKIVQANKSYTCKKCSKAFATYKDNKNHEVSCLETNQCSRCKKYFATYQYLVLHMKASESGKMFSCSKCHKSFNFKCELVVHRQSHTKIFMCQDCECVFIRYYHLREHIMTHCKVKPVVCRDCKETFIGSHALRKHRLEIHSGR